METKITTDAGHYPVPGWFEMCAVEAAALWHAEIVPALLAARVARGRRRRQVALDDAASVVAECVAAVGGLDAWHAGLLLGACADIAGVGLPLDASDVFDADRDADVFVAADWM